MRINNISYSQKMPYYKPAKQPSFCGLTKTFEKAVYTGWNGLMVKEQITEKNALKL